MKQDASCWRNPATCCLAGLVPPSWLEPCGSNSCPVRSRSAPFKRWRWALASCRKEKVSTRRGKQDKHSPLLCWCGRKLGFVTSPAKLLCFQPAPEGTLPPPHVGQGQPRVSLTPAHHQDTSYGLSCRRHWDCWPSRCSLPFKAGLSSFGSRLPRAGSRAGLKRERMYPLWGCCSSVAAAKLNFAAARTRSRGSRTESCCGRAEGPSWAGHVSRQSEGWDTPVSRRGLQPAPITPSAFATGAKDRLRRGQRCQQTDTPSPAPCSEGDSSSCAAFHPEHPKTRCIGGRCCAGRCSVCSS